MAKVVVLKPSDFGFDNKHSSEGLTRKDLIKILRAVSPKTKKDEPKKDDKKEEKKRMLTLVETWAFIALTAYILGPFIWWMQAVAIHSAADVWK